MIGKYLSYRNFVWKSVIKQQTKMNVDNRIMIQKVWDLLHFLLFLLATVSLNAINAEISALAQSASGEEYCQYETFQPLCSDSHVIMVSRALYGRMHVGRCVKADFGYVGCYTDVLDLLDRKCSGRKTCEFPVMDPSFDNRRPCNEEVKNYLEVDYVCVKVSSSSPFCTVDMSRPTNDVVYVRDDASLRAHDVMCGSKRKPLRIWAPPNKRINVTLIDFLATPLGGGAKHALVSTNDIIHSDGPCISYGYVKNDASEGRRVDLCGGRRRSTAIMTSQANSVDVILSDAVRASTAVNYLLMLQVVGCSNPVLGEGVKWIRTSEDTIDACCGDCSPASSSLTWRLTCRDVRWTGHVVNCTADVIAKSAMSSDGTSSSSADPPSLPTEIALGIVASVSVTICLSITAVGLILVKSKKLPRSVVGHFAEASAEDGERRRKGKRKCRLELLSRDLHDLDICGERDHRQQQHLPLLTPPVSSSPAAAAAAVVAIDPASVITRLPQDGSRPPTAPKCQHIAATRVTGYDVVDDQLACDGADVYFLTSSRNSNNNSNSMRRAGRTATLRLEPVCVYELHEYVDNAAQTTSCVETDEYDVGLL